MTQPLLQAADLRGAARLTTDAVVGLTSLVEAIHARVASLPLRAVAAHEERTRGITGLTYRTVRGVTQLAGGTADALLGWLAPTLAAAGADALPSAEREAVIAALNGVLGDHLAVSGNPLAVTMAFRHAGRPLVLDRFAMRSRLPQAGPRLLVLLHGLCMNDLQWQRDEHDHGEALARAAGYTPIHLHYNSGLSISTNGRVLAQMMERLLDAWPMPLERLALLGFSMGGLVARSALAHAAALQRGALRWPGRVDHLVCLGTPHHGAPLEQAGHGVDVLLAATPYAAPLARLSGLRGAGIADLRHGNVLAGGADGTHAHVPLPTGVRCHAIAATLGAADANAASLALGDGLVPVASALGSHREAARRLAFGDDDKVVVPHTSHLGLLSSAPAFDAMRRWLSAPGH